MLCCYLFLPLQRQQIKCFNMSNKKKTPKVKEPVKLRQKELANGNKSIYLAHWNNSNNKWEYEFLKDLYIIPETSPANKEANDNTMRLASAIKAKRIVELQNNVHGFTNNGTRSKVNVIEYIKSIAEQKRIKAGHKDKKAFQGYYALIRQIEDYSGTNTTFKQVDKAYCIGFLNYLTTATNKNKGICNKPLSDNTKYSYMRLFIVVLNAAISDDIISVNPFKQIKPDGKPKIHRVEINYLTVEEVKNLVKTECVIPVVKQSFLFSCFTGLRYSDVKKLKWEDIITDNEGLYVIKYTQQKTKKPEELQVSEEALKFLPNRGTATNKDNIFELFANGYVNQALKSWVLAAGINKRVTFHVGRHTNATLLLSLGVPIETVSKLLGHSDIQTTQIYAKVIDKNKREAVSKLDGLTD